MKFLIILAVFALIASALYQKWKSIPPQTKQMWGAIFGMAKSVRQAKKQMRENGGQPVQGGANMGGFPFEVPIQRERQPVSSSKMQACAQCGLHVPENEGVRARGQFYCCAEHAQSAS